MKGVTLTNFRRFVKADATNSDLRQITDAQVAMVCRRFYWDSTAGAKCRRCGPRCVRPRAAGRSACIGCAPCG
ncbi:glycosyl hydrolase 108 family protein [Mesorhizobium ciceri]|uniref:glycosyl hydrolase 108 family protein n=1 Tax=Mesorhizobium TaxID=68287 RepID=UPI001FCDD620|nr:MULTISPECIES: glycosyl hydrolase 108 family protein [Mesorhizobium]MDF3233422.1 glycosyl hydrolase 108 family protein [Mesorhizobium sp. DSM 30133]